jgi:hypothetical protein
VVKTAQRKWVCRNCGQRNKTVVAASGAMTCEYCTEVTAGRLVPTRADGVVVERSDASSGKGFDDTRNGSPLPSTVGSP